MKLDNNIENKYSFNAGYISNYQQFKKKILSKKIIPYQVEFQPPPKSIRNICWLKCSYCYGASADDTDGERMSKDLAIKTLNEIADGGIKKVIFAGYATDPLNSPYIEDLLEIAIDRKLIFGFNTKALKLSKHFLDLIGRNDLQPGSYISLSVDAGSNETYNAFHNIKSKINLYDRVLKNAKNISEIREFNNSKLDISAAYLINHQNSNIKDISKFINDFKDANCNLIRFTFPQQPRKTKLPKRTIPKPSEVENLKKEISPFIQSKSTKKCKVMIVDADSEYKIFNKARTSPCFARWLYPTVGYDGWLYHCSQSSSPNFRSFAIGDLKTSNFWDLFYNYNSQNMKFYMKDCANKMAKSGCRCDRKMHITNLGIIKSSAFEGIIN